MMLTLPNAPGMPDGYTMVSGPVMIAGKWLQGIPFAQHEEIEQLCEAHDLHACDVGAIEYDVVDLPLLRFTVYERNEQGNQFARPGTDVPASHTVDVALRTELPVWWRVEGTVEWKPL